MQTRKTIATRSAATGALPDTTVSLAEKGPPEQPHTTTEVAITIEANAPRRHLQDRAAQKA